MLQNTAYNIVFEMIEDKIMSCYFDVFEHLEDIIPPHLYKEIEDKDIHKLESDVCRVFDIELEDLNNKQLMKKKIVNASLTKIMNDSRKSKRFKDSIEAAKTLIVLNNLDQVIETSNEQYISAYNEHILPKAENKTEDIEYLLDEGN